MSNRKKRRGDRGLSRGNPPLQPVPPAGQITGPGLSRIQINNVFLPRSAADYEALDRLEPGRAAKILQLQEEMARANLRREEAQTAHRIAMESKQQSHDQRSATWGQVAAWSIAISALAGATYLGAIGQTAASIGMASSVVGAIALAFIQSKRSNAAERIKKMEVVAEAERGLRRLGQGQ
jgi:hypothetical protein